MIEGVCGVLNSANAAAWAQVIVIALTAGIALRKFYALVDNGRVKNTLKLLANFDIVRHRTPSGNEMTAAQASPLLEDGVKTVEATKQGTAGVDPREVAKASDAAVITYNYYADAARLIRRNLLDEKMFLDAHAYRITLSVKPTKVIIETFKPALVFAEIDSLERKAEAFLVKHPIFRPTASTGECKSS